VSFYERAGVGVGNLKTEESEVLCTDSTALVFHEASPREFLTRPADLRKYLADRNHMQVRTKNFSLAGGRGADPKGSYDLSLILKIML
jgi:hypothetical protein